jgi:hypothetical protein
VQELAVLHGRVDELQDERTSGDDAVASRKEVPEKDNESMSWSLFGALLKTNQGSNVMVAILGNVENKSGGRCYGRYFGQC